MNFQSQIKQKYFILQKLQSEIALTSEADIDAKTQELKRRYRKLMKEYIDTELETNLERAFKS